MGKAEKVGKLGHRPAGSSSYNSLVEEQGLAHILDLGNGTLQVKGFRKHNLEDLEMVSDPTTREISAIGSRTLTF